MNFTKLHSIPGTKWDHGLAKKNSEEKCFRDILNNSICQYIPMGNNYKRTKCKPRWLNNKVERHIHEKGCSLKNMCRHHASNTVKNAIRNARAEKS